MKEALLYEKQDDGRVQCNLCAHRCVIAEGKKVTYDMKPHRDDPTAVGTSEMADAIIAGM